jgi:hypothetical protein
VRASADGWRNQAIFTHDLSSELTCEEQDGHGQQDKGPKRGSNDHLYSPNPRRAFWRILDALVHRPQPEEPQNRQCDRQRNTNGIWLLPPNALVHGLMLCRNDNVVNCRNQAITLTTPVWGVVGEMAMFHQLSSRFMVSG